MNLKREYVQTNTNYMTVQKPMFFYNDYTDKNEYGNKSG